VLRAVLATLCCATLRCAALCAGLGLLLLPYYLMPACLRTLTHTHQPKPHLTQPTPQNQQPLDQNSAAPFTGDSSIKAAYERFTAAAADGPLDTTTSARHPADCSPSAAGGSGDEEGGTKEGGLLRSLAGLVSDFGRARAKDPSGREMKDEQVR